MDDRGAQGEDGGFAALGVAAGKEGFKLRVELFVFVASGAIEEAVAADFGFGGVIGERAPEVLGPETEDFALKRFAKENVLQFGKAESAAGLIDRAIDQPAEDVLATEADETAQFLLDGDRDVGTQDHRLGSGEPERGREDAGDAGDLVLFGDPTGGEKDVMAHDDIGLEGPHGLLHGEVRRLDKLVKEGLDDEIGALALIGEAGIVEDLKEVGLVAERDELDAGAADSAFKVRIGEHGDLVAAADQLFADGDVGMGVAGGTECCEEDAHERR